MTTTFETAKVGDRVYALARGWTTIEEIGGSMAGFPIVTSGTYTYSLDGRYLVGGDQVLFWDKPTITAPAKPEPKVAPKVAPPVDTLVEVTDSHGDKCNRYSAGRIVDDVILCWSEGRTSKTASNKHDTTAWKSWRIVEGPDSEGWIKHEPTADSVCPVERGVPVDVKHRSGSVYYRRKALVAGYAAYDWTDIGNGSIVAYRLSR
jgi:hypothetical protein